MYRSFRLPAWILLCGFALPVLQAQDRAADPRTVSEFPRAVVAADHPLASQAGLEILKQGGNVVDAAVATSFALSVVRPTSCGIGGGGFMVIWDADRQHAVALDYRERAPLAATRDMYSGDAADNAAEPLSVRGHQAVAVPGTVAGLCYAAEHYGTLPLDQLMAPAIRLAREGVIPDQNEREVQQITTRKLKQHDGYTERFDGLYRGYLNSGERWTDGERFYSPQLRALELIAEQGPSAFYEGAIAESIVAGMKANGGLITHEDLRGIEPVVREPLRGSFNGCDVITMPPASSGGVALLQTLAALDHWEQQNSTSLRELGHNSPRYIHVVTEAMKHAFADRAEFLGDMDFADVPIERMLSETYARDIAQRIGDTTQPLESYGRFFAANDSGTSHLSVIDAHGNAVACTETINLYHGSFVTDPEFGILLNDEMDDFAAKPGEPNAFGLLQSEANAVAPRKKPLSSMTPTILVRDGKAVWVAGASGGPKIISTTIQVLLNESVFGAPPDQAVRLPRFHHQWFPNELVLEESLFGIHCDALNLFGHDVKSSGGLAVNQSVSRTSWGTVRGGSDPRKYGQPAGW